MPQLAAQSRISADPVGCVGLIHTGMRATAPPPQDLNSHLAFTQGSGTLTYAYTHICEQNKAMYPPEFTF